MGTIPPMLLFWRKLLFYILLVVYMVITPYAILYALGYWVSPAKGEIFNKTGLLSVMTEPRGARIFVEGKKYSHKTQAAVQGLLPGGYSIKISKKGFESWEKNVSVSQGLATRLEPVILLPVRPDEESVTGKSMQKLLPVLVDFKIFGLENYFLESLTGTDIFLKRESDAGQKISGAQKVTVTDFQTKAGSALVLFKTAKGFFAVHLGKEKQAKDLNGFIPASVDLLDWDAKSPDLIYFLKDGVISAVDWRKGTLTAPVAIDVLGFGIKHGRLVLLKKDFTLWSAGPKGENPKQEIGQEEGLQKLAALGNAKWFRIEVLRREFFQKDLIIFLSDQGALLSSREPYLLAEKGVQGYQYATRSDDEKLLFWTRQEISIIDFVKSSEESFQKSPLRILVTDKGRDISQAY